ncbi:dynein axonemal light chain 4 [Nematocida sp. LUAm3]|nr:dynein axonemal light chain 4 [Nematocida sp. LUAm3]KAI5175552.1 dynein axonemal light chain 4 [Nematocida sp. LUAm2]KAI5178418.1 dynein axonemal light chain 4 [Nematocida sp. LUAm1]
MAEQKKDPPKIEQEKAQEKRDILQEKKIEVIAKDINEEIRVEVADLCLSAKDITDVKNESRRIKDSLDKKFDGGWNVIMGESFSGSCTVADQCFLQLKISGILILVFKSMHIVKNKKNDK